MADGEQVAGQTISTIGPVLNAVPYVGPILSAAASIGGGLLQSDAAKKQAAQAAKVRQDALNTAVQPMRPEYTAALHLARMHELGGLPGLQVEKGDLAQQLADQIRYIHMAAPGGNAALAAMSKAVSNQSAGLRGLQAKDELFRGNASADTAKTLWNVGDAGRKLEDIRDEQRTGGLKAAAALENASMLNKQGGYNTAAFGAAQGANSIFQNLLKLGGTGNGTSTATPAQTNFAGTTSTANIGLAQTPNQLLHQYLTSTSPGEKLDSAGFFSGMSGSGNGTAPVGLTGAPNPFGGSTTTDNINTSPASLGVMDY